MLENNSTPTLIKSGDIRQSLSTDGLVRKNSLEIKTALDRGVEYNGNMPVLLEAYATFGIVPYVLEGAA